MARPAYLEAHYRSSAPPCILLLYAALLLPALAGCDPFLIALQRGDAWTRHTIDATSSGADGVRMGDANGDGQLDLVVPWEEGGEVVLYFHPGTGAKSPWPRLRVGSIPAVEDALLVDLDADGALDVVSCAEGRTRAVFVHWAPSDPQHYTTEENWSTTALPASEGQQQWLNCTALDVNGDQRSDLVAGGKEDGAQIGWFEAPTDPRILTDWRWHAIGEAGWIMSMVASDVDSDGDMDLLATDRVGPDRGTWWFDNPAAGPLQQLTWKRRLVGDAGVEVMFMDLTDLDGDGLQDVLVATAGKALRVHLRQPGAPPAWTSHEVAIPDFAGNGKAVRAGDVNGDGQMDIALSCEGAEGHVGVLWMSYLLEVTDTAWLSSAVSGLEGAKFDVLQLLDVDGDGDLDIITTEEDANLGVVWYENPFQRLASSP